MRSALTFFAGAAVATLACCDLLTPATQAAAVEAGKAALPAVVDAVKAPGGIDWPELAKIGGGVVAAIAGSLWGVNKMRGPITARKGLPPKNNGGAG